MKLSEEQLKNVRHNLAMAMHLVSVPKMPRRKEKIAYHVQQAQMVINPEIFHEQTVSHLEHLKDT